nr:hypothetical protein GLBDPPGF_00016 [uncultured bacterium]
MTPTFFTDRDLGKQFPAILKDAGLHVERHLDHFAPDATDESWLEVVGRRGWLAVTHDGRIRYKPNELAAVMRHQVALFVVIGQATHAELAHAFVKTLPSVVRFSEQHSPPYIAKVHRPSPSEIAKNPEARGTVTLWHPVA